jgi:hypothetical protein
MTRKLLTPLLTFSLLFLFGCKEEVQKAKEDLVVDLIVNNLWVVTNFTEGANNITTSFAPYDFKFNRDESVLGRKAGASDAVGTWKGSAENMTITSSFPTGPAPLDKLTGVWNITKTTLTTVKSTRSENGITYFLDLQKK